jgi:hypothetical protein
MANYNFLDFSNSNPNPSTINNTLPIGDKLKVGFIGVEKRVSNQLLPLFAKSNNFEVVGFWEADKIARDKFHNETKVPTFETLQSLAENVNALIVCVSQNKLEEITDQAVKTGLPVLVETPVMSLGAVKLSQQNNQVFGAIEQWPFLPIEQFKLLYKDRFLRTSAYLAVNDCRSFDYHAIAQLRTYVGRDQLPLNVKATHISIEAPFNHKNNSGEVVNTSDSWDISHVQLENAVLIHNFSYMCKTAPFRKMQTLKCITADGTMISGRMNSHGSDYEILEFSHLSHEETVDSVIKVTRKDNTTVEIKDEVTGLAWSNPYKDLCLNDQETALMTVVDGFRNKILGKESTGFYPASEALTDTAIMTGIKTAIASQKSVEFKHQ